MNRYETMMLASAHNLRDYCSKTSCSNCIFRSGVTVCMLTTPDNPWNWELDKVVEKVGDTNATNTL